MVFRGGTALHKLFLGHNSRYSEDIDLVLTQSQKYGEIIGALRETLTPWLGKPRFDQKQERLTLHFKFMSEIEPIQQMKLKVEINTSETFNVMGIIEKDFTVESPWFSGHTKIKTFSPEELLGTKFRALYQRDKGRDLFDVEMAHKILKLDIEKVMNCFSEYTKRQGLNITRALFEEQLFNKKNSKKFLNDMSPLPYFQQPLVLHSTTK